MRLNEPLHSTPSSMVDRFLFTPIDARIAAIFRIALACFLAFAFLDLSLRPIPPLSTLPYAMWIYNHIILRKFYMAAIAVLCGALAIGYRPRLVGLVLFVILVPLGSLSSARQSRQILLMTLLAFSMVRSDGQWSWRTLRGGLPFASAGPIWPIRLIQIQLCLVYLINAYAKSTREYLHGDILIGMSRMRGNFLVNLSDGYQHIGPLRIPVMAAAIASVIIEFWLAIGFWFPRTRWLTAVIGVIFHLGLQQIVHIYMLDLASMFLYLAFLLPWVPRTRDSVLDSPQRAAV